MLRAGLLAACMAVAMADQCPSISVVDPFYVHKFLGTWYQQSSFGTFLTQGFGKCAKAVYTASDDNTISVQNTQKSILNRPQEVKGSAVLADPTSTEGKLVVTLSTALGEQTGDLWVLATDYDNYAILWSCNKILGVVFKSAWVLTKVQQLKDEEKTKVDGLLDDAFEKMSNTEGAPKKTDFSPTSQDNC